MKSKDVIMDLISILGEASPHEKEIIKRAIAEIENQRETISTLTKDSVETLNASIETLRAIHPGKDANAFFIESKKMVENASPEYRPFIALARVRAAATVIRESAPPSSPLSPTGSDPLRYDTKTLNQKRGEALAAHVQRTSKTAMKSTEMKTVLETIEGRTLDRKTVHRAMDVARGILRATSEVVGGIRRIVLSSPSPGAAGRSEEYQKPVDRIGGDRGGLSRPRRWGVPWDGVD
jgi:hypothetical protein